MHGLGTAVLTPTAFLDRSAAVFGDRIAVVDGDRTYTYAQLRDRCTRLAGALASCGVSAGDRISTLLPNTHVALESHFGVPWAGAVLNALNTRLSAAELGYIVGHAGSKVLLCDHSLLELGEAVVTAADQPVQLIVCDDPAGTYEARLADATPQHSTVDDEFSLLSLNYTSGTTGRPKGVMYGHRGGFLQSLAMLNHSGLNASSVFLWTLPMFHCNGWCFPWAVTAAGATHVALREVRPDAIWTAIQDLGVTHLNAAPTVLTSLIEDPPKRSGDRRVHVATGGAPPSPALLRRLDDAGIDVAHLYGLTETYGPAVLCDWHPEWHERTEQERAERLARQGVVNVVGSALRVVDERGDDVPPDGASQGEVILQGNNVMLGYYRDEEATQRAIFEDERGSWLRTGDVGVLHSDGYLELRDRAKDVIISGGENVASIEVEQVLDAHPAVLESAVVAAPDEKWGEVPVAFVTLREAGKVTEADLILFVKSRIARFKAPKRIVFGELPKTATGKVQKYQLRDKVRSGWTSSGSNRP